MSLLAAANLLTETVSQLAEATEAFSVATQDGPRLAAMLALQHHADLVPESEIDAIKANRTESAQKDLSSLFQDAETALAALDSQKKKLCKTCFFFSVYLLFFEISKKPSKSLLEFVPLFLNFPPSPSFPQSHLPPPFHHN